MNRVLINVLKLQKMLMATSYEKTYYGKITYDAKNDRGYDWWLNVGHLVVEDPAYCASVSGKMSAWIDGIVAGK